MINEISIHPKPQNNKAKISFLIAISIFGIALVASAFVDKYRGVIALFAVISVTYALHLFTKYITTEYYYDITVPEGDLPLLVVRQVTGKRSSVLSRVALSDIVKVEFEGAELRREKKTPGGFMRYVYTPTMSPDKTIRITVTSRYEKAEIILEGTEEFAKLLSDYAAEARALYPNNYE